MAKQPPTAESLVEPKEPRWVVTIQRGSSGPMSDSTVGDCSVMPYLYPSGKGLLLHCLR